jgi:hypothetical protein
MIRAKRRNRTVVAAPLASLLLTLSVAVPIVERADLTHAPVVESEHQPGSCPAPHDHTVCTQVGANHAAPREDAGVRCDGVIRRAARMAAVDRARDVRLSRSVSARAPPST